MSRYEWPIARRSESDDDPGGRGEFLGRQRVEFDPAGVRALARGTPPQPSVARPRAPVNGRTHLWQPLGPDTVVGGQAIGATRIAGRINMLAVHPDGERVYAASANGGVWYSGNGGVAWRSLGGLASTPAPGTVNRPAQRHACGAIAVASHRGRHGPAPANQPGAGTRPRWAASASWCRPPWPRGEEPARQGVPHRAQPGGSGVVAPPPGCSSTSSPGADVTGAPGRHAVRHARGCLHRRRRARARAPVGWVRTGPSGGLGARRRP
jgi:hypothetical protein